MPTANIPRERLKHLILIALALLTFYPFSFMVMTSFKNNNEFFHFFWTPTLPIEWINYVYAWRQISGYMINSVVISSLSIVGVLVVSSLSAYAFARGSFP